MHIMRYASVFLLSSALLSGSSAIAQMRPDSQQLLAAQKEAMSKFSFMDGVWRGPASTTMHNGEKHAIAQTERIGPLLDGSIKLMEGRGYKADGTTSFNAFAVLSFNPATKAYSMRSYAQGNVGDFPVTLTADGFSWEIPAGPMTIRYTATVKDGQWREVGDRIQPGKEPVRFFEMNLKRVGDSPWPGAGAITPN